MKKFLSGLKLVWAYWISALTVELFFRASKILELVPIIERDIIIGIIFIGMYVYSSTIVVACDGIKKNRYICIVSSVYHCDADVRIWSEQYYLHYKHTNIYGKLCFL